MKHAAILILAAAALLSGCSGGSGVGMSDATKDFNLDVLPAHFEGRGLLHGMGYVATVEGTEAPDVIVNHYTCLFHEGLSYVQGDDMWGFVNLDGELVVDFMGNGLKSGFSKYFSEGLFLIDKDDEDVIVAYDHKGNVKFEVEGEGVISQMCGSYALIKGEHGANVINDKGEIVFESEEGERIPKYYDRKLPAAYAHPSYFPIFSDTGFEYFLDVATGKHLLEGMIPDDVEGNNATEYVIDSNDLLALRTSDGWGLLDLEGQWVVAPSYEYMRNDGEWYVIRQGGYIGWINAKGETMIEPEFERKSSADVAFGPSDWCLVYGKFIDRKGQVVLEPDYIPYTNFFGDRCLVRYDRGQYGWMDRNGEIIGEPFYASEDMAETQLALISRGVAIQYF